MIIQHTRLELVRSFIKDQPEKTNELIVGHRFFPIENLQGLALICTLLTTKLAGARSSSGQVRSASFEISTQVTAPLIYYRDTTHDRQSAASADVPVYVSASKELEVKQPREVTFVPI